MAPKEPINSTPVSMECLGDDMTAKCKPPIVPKLAVRNRNKSIFSAI